VIAGAVPTIGTSMDSVSSARMSRAVIAVGVVGVFLAARVAAALVRLPLPVSIVLSVMTLLSA
jgi:hypothetical protein